MAEGHELRLPLIQKKMRFTILVSETEQRRSTPLLLLTDFLQFLTCIKFALLPRKNQTIPIVTPMSGPSFR